MIKLRTTTPGFVAHSQNENQSKNYFHTVQNNFK